MKLLLLASLVLIFVACATQNKTQNSIEKVSYQDKVESEKDKKDKKRVPTSTVYPMEERR